MLRSVSHRLPCNTNCPTWLSRRHISSTWILQSRKISSGIPSRPRQELKERYIDRFETQKASGKPLHENFGSESGMFDAKEVKGTSSSLEYGEVLKEGRYRLEGKLGFGKSSHVWLARDLQKDQFVAIKILSSKRLKLENLGHKQELAAYTRINTKAGEAKHSNCSTMLDSFCAPIFKKDGANNLCLVLPFMQASLDDVINSSKKQIPIDSIKKVLTSVLKALKFLHQNKIVHKEITPRDVMIKMNPQFDVDKWLSKLPQDTIADFSSLLPQPALGELADDNVGFVLSDLGSAALLDQPSPRAYHAQMSLQPPEILIGDKWDQSVDIWNLGTMAYYLLTRKELFPSTPTIKQLKTMWPPNLRPKRMKMFIKRRGTIPESHEWLLYQMSAVCESDLLEGSFPKDMLEDWYKRNAETPENKLLFDLQGRLMTFRWAPLRYGKYTRLKKTPFPVLLKDSQLKMSSEEQIGAAMFLNRCVQLHPTKRASAAELLEDAWLKA